MQINIQKKYHDLNASKLGSTLSIIHTLSIFAFIYTVSQ